MAEHSHEAKELFAAATNGGPVNKMVQVTARGAMLVKGSAPGRWAVLATEAAKYYVRDFCGPHHKVSDMFSDADILECAALLSRYFVGEASARSTVTWSPRGATHAYRTLRPERY